VSKLPEKSVKVEREAQLAIVSINRPDQHNAINAALLQGLVTIFSRLKEDETVHGILLTGAGESFCAGADIHEMRQMSVAEAAAFAEAGQRLMFAIERLGKPVLAAVNGHALGGGLDLALACDFIVAARSASFAAPEVQLGVIPGFGGTQRLSRLVGKAKAKELIFTGDRFGATEAYQIGLVNRLYDDHELQSKSLELLRQICSRGLVSLRLAKDIIDAGYDIDLATACLMERDAFAICFTTEDQKEGMGAFVEKRKPQFKGR